MENDIKRLRRELLKAEIEKQGLAVVAKKACKPDRQINDMAAGRKTFGDKIAREIGPLIRPDLAPDWLLSPSSRSKNTLSFSDDGATTSRNTYDLTAEELQLVGLFRDIPSNEQSALISLLKARSESIHPAAEIDVPETKFKIERPNDLIKSHLGTTPTQTINTRQGAE